MTEPIAELPSEASSEEERSLARGWLIAVHINPDLAPGGQYSLASLLAAHRRATTNKIRDEALRLLGDTLKAPGMFAVTREGLIMRAATLCELLVPSFPHMAFYERHMERHGSSLPGMDKPLDDEWARGVLRDAIAQLTSSFGLDIAASVWTATNSEPER